MALRVLQLCFVLLLSVRSTQGQCLESSLPTGYVAASSGSCDNVAESGTCLVACATGYGATGGSDSTMQCLSGAWDGLADSCAAITCTADANTASHSSNCSGQVSVNSVCRVSCNAGYSGSEVDRSCTGSVASSTGNLTNSLPTCTAVTCNADTEFTGYSSNCSGTSVAYDTSCSTSCVAGTTGTATSRVCGQSGSFDGANPTCTAVTCNANTAFSGFASNCSGTSVAYDTSCSTSCVAGTTGTATARVCGQSGTFDGANPTCTPVTCNANTAFSAFASNCSGTSVAYDTSCSTSCVAGTSGTATARVCGQSGTFDGADPTCTAVTCNAATAFTGFDSTCTSATTAYNTACSVDCPAGTTGSSTSRTCGQSGSFDGANPSCTGVTCDADAEFVGFVSNCSGAAVAFGTDCGVTCPSGQTGSSIRVCQVGGFSGSGNPTCTAITCDATAVVSPHTINCTSATEAFGSACRIDCEFGFTGTGTDAICGAGGFGTLPTCTIVRCTGFNEAGFDPTNCPDADYDTTCTPDCATGYVDNTVSGSISFSCDGTGAWVLQNGVCDAVDCGPLSLTGYNDSLCLSTTYGEVCAPSCVEGFAALSQPSFVCDLNGAWQLQVSSDECLVITCATAPSQTGYVFASGCDNSDYNDNCTFACDTGYFGAAGQVTCRSDSSGSGVWTVSTACSQGCDAFDSAAINGVGTGAGCAGGANGVTCSVACAPGYLGTTTDVTCTAGVWSTGPTCAQDTATCPIYGDAVHITLNTTGNCAGATYGQVCAVHCNPIYSGPTADSPVYITCGTAASGQWNNAGITCIDVTAPVVTCPQNQLVPNTAAGANADIPALAANDAVDGMINGTVKVGTWTNSSGVPHTYFFPIGNTTVSYRFTDAAHNNATCSYLVTVYDVDACIANPCPDLAVCTDSQPPAGNNAAGRTCSCRLGWTLEGTQCLALIQPDFTRISFRVNQTYVTAVATNLSNTILNLVAAGAGVSNATIAVYVTAGNRSDVVVAVDVPDYANPATVVSYITTASAPGQELGALGAIAASVQQTVGLNHNAKKSNALADKEVAGIVLGVFAVVFPVGIALAWAIKTGKLNCAK